MANHLLPPNATPQERAVSETLSRTDTINVPIRALWRPYDCPERLLPWLAWALSVDEWDEQWSEAQKRNAIDASVYLHRHKGTPAAVQRAVDLIFDDAEVQEWFHYGGQPFHFRVVSEGAFTSERDYQRLIRLIESAKNARSWLEAIVIRSHATQSVYLGTFTHTGTTLSIAYEVDLNTEVSPLQFGLGSVTHTGKSVGVGHTIALQPDAAHSYTAAAAHTGTTLQIRPAGVDITLQDSALRFGGAYHVSKTINIHARADEWLISPA